jgi:hypothetical protein
MFKKSLKHLEESQAGYFEHFKFAIKAGILLLIAGFASLIHAIVPQWFQGTAAFTVIRLYKKRLENHPNPMYHEEIKKSDRQRI